MKYTQEYFNEELLRFHKMMGDKQFWALPKEQRDRAFEGLAYVYLYVDDDTKTESNASLLDAAGKEYTRREGYMIFYPSVKEFKQEEVIQC